MNYAAGVRVWQASCYALRIHPGRMPAVTILAHHSLKASRDIEWSYHRNDFSLSSARCINLWGALYTILLLTDMVVSSYDQ